MKKIFFILIFILAPCYALDYSYYCTENSVLKTASGVLMSTSGANFLARKIAEKEIASALKKETSSKFKVNVNTFWGSNIANGEFSKFKAVSKKFSDKNFSAQKLELETVCPYNKISYQNGELNFDSNMVLKFNSEINQDNLSKILKQKVQIDDDKIVFDYKISAFGIKTTLKMQAGLEVVDNKVQLCDVKLNKSSIKASKYLSMLNLTNFKVELNKNTKADVKIDDVKIKNSIVYLSGNILIPQSY